MEIKLETANRYELSLDELRRLYLTLALTKYVLFAKSELLIEDRLLNLLKTYVSKLQTDTQLLLEQTPNNRNYSAP